MSCKVITKNCSLDSLSPQPIPQKLLNKYKWKSAYKNETPIIM